MMTNWINNQKRRTIASLVFLSVLLFTWGLDTHGNFAGSGDEPHYAMIAHSLVFDRDLDLSNDYDDASNLVGAGGLRPETHAVRGDNGQLRPVHDIGLPVLFAPYFALAYRIAEASPRWISARTMARARLNPPLVLRHLLSLGMVVVAGGIAILLFQIFRSYSDENASAMWWTFAFVLAPPLMSHSFLFFTEIPSAFIATLFYRELTLRHRPTVLRTATLGAAVGFLLLLHIRNAGLVVGMIALFLWAGREQRQTFAFVAPISLFATIRTILNFHLWGNLVTSPHASPAPLYGFGEMSTEAATRILGLLFDQEHGLLAYAPIYLLVLPGALALRKEDRCSFVKLAVLVVAYVTPVILPAVNRHGWDGGWSPAARFLVPITPMLAIFVFGYVSQRRAVPFVVLPLVSLQMALDLLFWARPKLMWNGANGASALAKWFANWADIARWLPSWERPSAYSAVLSATLLGLWIAASFGMVRATVANSRARS